MTIQEVFEKYLPKFRKTSSTPHLDIEVLLCFVLGKNSAYIGAHPEYQLASHESLKLIALLKRRMKSEPIAYIIGNKEFYGLDFSINSNVLVPRPETEVLVSHVIEYINELPKEHSLLVADIGTGSGSIITSLAKNISHDAGLVGIDISHDALKVANANIQNHQLGEKVKLFCGNLLEPLQEKLQNYNHTIIIANLPYLPHDHISSTSKDLEHEPKLALYANNQGFDLYPKLLDQILNQELEKFTGFFELLEEHIPLLQEYAEKHDLHIEQIPTSFSEPVFVKIEK